MRPLAAGLSTLALAILVTWMIGERARPAAAWMETPSYTLPGSVDASSTAAALQAGKGITLPGDRVDALTTSISERRAVRTPGGESLPSSRPAFGAAGGAPPPIRHFAPGSKEHARAIASNLESQQVEEIVSPLARLYFAFFGRYPDYEGLNHYVGERETGRDLASIADEFAGSAELEMRYGLLDNAAFVDRILANVGAMDHAQRAVWIAQLESGALTRGQFVIAFSEDIAFVALLSNEVFVARAYAEILRRTPDPAGFARWVARLNAGHPRQSVIEGLLGSK